MEYLFADNYGLIHLIASICALISGTLVLVTKKGTRSHIKIGYVYVISMVTLLATALMIYRLFNGWGIFHYFTIMSLLTLAFGMIPIWLKSSFKNWMNYHFSFMYWSVIGLYAAFASEILTRVPESPFFWMLGIATGLIIGTGAIFFKLYKDKWAKTFNVEDS